jgi:hypothetical protein
MRPLPQRIRHSRRRLRSSSTRSRLPRSRSPRSSRPRSQRPRQPQSHWRLHRPQPLLQHLLPPHLQPCSTAPLPGSESSRRNRWTSRRPRTTTRRRPSRVLHTVLLPRPSPRSKRCLHPSPTVPPPQRYREPGPPPRYGTSSQTGGPWDAPPERWMQPEPWRNDNQPSWGRNQFRESFQDPPPKDTEWGNYRQQEGPLRYRSNQGSGGPVRGNGRGQSLRNPQSRPPAPTQPRSYERPKQTMRQSAMPFFKTVEGKFVQLCVFTAQDQQCPDPKCEFSHEPRRRRICPLFHNPKERCPHNPCLLGHDEPREAFKASKAFGRCERLAKWQEENLVLEAAQNRINMNPLQNPEAATLLQAPIPDPKPHPTENKAVTESAAVPNPGTNAPPAEPSVPPVNFKTYSSRQTRSGARTR